MGIVDKFVKCNKYSMINDLKKVNLKKVFLRSSVVAGLMAGQLYLMMRLFPSLITCEKSLKNYAIMTVPAQLYFMSNVLLYGYLKYMTFNCSVMEMPSFKMDYNKEDIKERLGVDLDEMFFFKETSVELLYLCAWMDSSSYDDKDKIFESKKIVDVAQQIKKMQEGDVYRVVNYMLSNGFESVAFSCSTPSKYEAFIIRSRNDKSKYISNINMNNCNINVVTLEDNSTPNAIHMFGEMLEGLTEHQVLLYVVKERQQCSDDRSPLLFAIKKTSDNIIYIYNRSFMLKILYIKNSYDVLNNSFICSLVDSVKDDSFVIVFNRAQVSCLGKISLI